MLSWSCSFIIISITKFYKMSANYFFPPQRNQVNHFNYYYFDKEFNDETIDRVKKIGDSIPKQRGEVGGGSDGTVSEYRKSDIAWIPDNQDSAWLYSKIADLSMIANKEMWNFDIWGYHDSLQYTTYYGDGGHYDWHADLGPNMSNRKLSVVLQLSDPSEYEGGELQMNIGGSIISVPRQKGLICFFPSFVLHRVTPLTSGIRTSLVTWLCGANLR
jgi:PKHD-type hydroxylase